MRPLKLDVRPGKGASAATAFLPGKVEGCYARAVGFIAEKRRAAGRSQNRNPVLRAGTHVGWANGNRVPGSGCRRRFIALRQECPGMPAVIGVES